MSKKFKRLSPIIFTVLSIAGLIGTAVSAAKGAVKAQREIDRNKALVDEDCWTRKAEIAIAWKYYIPTALCSATTTVCIIAIGILGESNQAGLAGAYAMLAENFRQYRQAAKELYGEEADAKIIAEVAKKTAVYSQGLLYNSSLYDPDKDGSEPVLFYDMFSRNYFTTTLAAVINAQYHINRNLCLRGYANLNEYYSFIGVAPIDKGEEIGWDAESLCLEFDTQAPWLEFDNRWTPLEDGMGCYVITFTEPVSFDGDLDI